MPNPANAIAAANPPATGWRGVFPPAQWLATYRPQWPGRDAVAGATLVEAHAAVRDRLRAEGLDERVGPLSRRISVADIVETFRAPAGREAAV
jgi:hypothetical protein